jgi:hypothetical protein
MGNYGYVVNDSNSIYSRIGKSCSIGPHTGINPGIAAGCEAYRAHRLGHLEALGHPLLGFAPGRRLTVPAD